MLARTRKGNRVTHQRRRHALQTRVRMRYHRANAARQQPRRAHLQPALLNTIAAQKGVAAKRAAQEGRVIIRSALSALSTPGDVARAFSFGKVGIEGA